MAGSSQRLRLALVGWGSIARRAAGLLRERQAPVDVVAVAMRGPRPATGDLPAGCAVLSSPADLVPGSVDLVIEAASAAAVADWGNAAFDTGADFAPVSVSALIDDGLRTALTEKAKAAGRRLLIPNGAIGGTDILRAAGILPLRRVQHVIVKPPAAWKGTLAESLIDLDGIKMATEFHSGSAREIAALFPKNANATVTTALAGLGLDETVVRLVADPANPENRHSLRIEGDAGSYQINLANRPMSTNPASSELTALSLVALAEEQASLRPW